MANVQWSLFVFGVFYWLYLWVISRVEFLGDGRNVLFQELQPLLFKFNLVHVDVHSWNVLVSTSQTFILNGKQILYITKSHSLQPKSLFLLSWVRRWKHYLVGSSRPPSIVLHGLHQVIAHLLWEGWEPVNIWTRLKHKQIRWLLNSRSSKHKWKLKARYVIQLYKTIAHTSKFIKKWSMLAYRNTVATAASCG